MKKQVLISMYALHIGGAERSLIGLLESFDYKEYDVDLFLYRHEGEFLSYIPKEVTLLPAIKQYTTLERPIKNIVTEGHIYLGAARILAKIKTKIKNRGQQKEHGTYKQMQYTWRYSLPALPKLPKHYDLAISFLGPHDFVLKKVSAKTKVGWNHTDYFTIVNPDKKLDEKMWNNLDYIVNVSDSCRESFLKVFPRLQHKAIIVENIISPSFVMEHAKQGISNELNYDDGAFKICSVGRLCDAKGFDMAIVACKELVDKGYNIRWYIVGSGGDEEYLRKLIDQYKVKERFILLGQKINPYPYIQNCDIYCQPSRYEGKAVTVTEAKILCKPILITNYPTARSQLVDGAEGIICDLSIEGVVNGIERLHNNKQLRGQLIANLELSDYEYNGEMKKLYRMIANASNKS